VNSEDKVLEIILIPFDKSEEDFKNYYKPMPWLAIALGDDRIAKFIQYFKINKIPKLIVLKSNGEVISSGGRMEVISDGEEAFTKWR
jgi:nucleoredoxin